MEGGREIDYSEGEFLGMEFPLNTNWAQAPDNEFSLLNNRTASGTDKKDEIENGLPPESSVPSFPARHANAQQSSLMNREIIGRESQIWNPYSPLPPLSTCPSALTTEEPSCDVVVPQSSTVLATEDENYALDLQLLLMADLDTAEDVCNPYLDQLPLDIGDSNKQSYEIVGGVSENHFMDVGAMSCFYNLYYDRLRLYVNQIDERRSEIVTGVSENQCRVGQSQQIDYPTGATTDEPSSEVVAPPNSTVLAIENGQSILPFNSQMMANPLAFSAVGCPPSTSYYPLGLGFRQNNIVHSDPFDGSSTSISELQEYYMEDLKRITKNHRELHENINPRYSEVDHGKKKRKPNDGRRRCCCKKSKCIQRYCECFYSGFFCDDACGCKGCNNTSEQGTLVMEKRAEMERKNSLAFSPKIEPLNQEDTKRPGIQLFGRNKRHKRGCSCTKSKCLKNYCECYQANVKCSVACRCKECGNMDTREHDAGSANFMTGEVMSNNVNTHRFHSNGGEMSSISSVVPLQHWVPRESTSFGNSIISYPTFGPRLNQSMNFYEASPSHNGTPLMLNDSRFPTRTNSPDRKWIPPPRFPVPEAGSGLSTPSLPPLISSGDADGRSNGQGDDKKKSEVKYSF